ncbi:MAG TPA: hypothetical protein VNN22_06550, partial [Verrucomicrobiae bacterium]|nr:hypothetical protein [Verrucomicrobiae bacterium]
MIASAQSQPKAAATSFSSFTSVHSGVLQRKCACGGKAGSDGECEECRKKRLQRKTRNAESGTQNDMSVPPIVHEVLRSPGQPLDKETRAFMEPRFGHDFSHVDVFSTAPGVEHRQHRFAAMIPRATASIFRDDVDPEKEPTNEASTTESETPVEEPAVETEQPAPETAAREPKEGETISVPDVELKDVLAFTIAQADPVKPTLDYTPHVDQLILFNACPFHNHPVFGLTADSPPSIINISVTPVLGWYYVDATLDEKITYQVCD